MRKYIILFLGILILSGCTPRSVPDPEGSQVPPGTEGVLGESSQSGERGIQGPPGPSSEPGKSVSVGIVNTLKNKLDQIDKSNKEEICALISYKEGFAPPILGFAALTTNGKILLMQNTSPVNIGNKFTLLTQIADRADFVSLSVLSGEEGEKTYYVAITSNGHHYYSLDLKEWNSQGHSPF